jgi:translocation and assembly module TamB
VGVPSLHGELEWTNGELSLEGYGGYQKIHLLASGDTQHLEVKDLSASSNGGSLTLTAQATRDGNGMTLAAKSELRKFPIVSSDQLVATVSFRSDIQGQITRESITIPRLAVAQALIELPDKAPKSLQSLDRPDDIVLITDTKTRNRHLARSPVAPTVDEGTGGSARSGTSPPRDISIAVDAPRNLWVRGQDLNIEVGLTPGFHIEITDKPMIFGTIKLLRGRVDVLGRRFDVEKDSELRFSGNPTKPYLNVTALYNNDAEHVKVYLSVQGQGTDVTIKPSSEPPLSESEIYTLIATGRRTLKRGSGAATTAGSQATSIVGSLVASELKKTLSSKLPLDVFSIEAGDSGVAGTKLEAGTYLGDKFYVGYTGRYGADPYRGENTNAVRLEYQFSSSWHIEAEYGDAKAGSMDLVWTRDY